MSSTLGQMTDTPQVTISDSGRSTVWLSKMRETIEEREQLREERAFQHE